MAKKSVRVKNIKDVKYSSTSKSGSKNIMKNRWVVIAIVLLVLIILFLSIGPYFTGNVVLSAEDQATYNALYKSFQEAGIANPRSLLDSDGDGIPITGKNPDDCATIPNRDQRDTDKDGIGNACDTYDNVKKVSIIAVNGKTSSGGLDADKDGLNADIDPYDYVWNNIAPLLNSVQRSALNSYWGAEVRAEIRGARPSPTGTASPTPTYTPYGGGGSPSPSPTETTTPTPTPTGTASPQPSGTGTPPEPSGSP